jgi:hypothetical protein
MFQSIAKEFFLHEATLAIRTKHLRVYDLFKASRHFASVETPPVLFAQGHAIQLDC